MQALKLPPAELKIENRAGKNMVFDGLRKKWLVLTPEEWVRQHMIFFLIQYRSYPKGLISTEQGLQVNKLSKRSDILVHDRQGKPFLLVECKAPTVKLTSEVFHQALSYNTTLGAKYVVLTNGLRNFCGKVMHGGKLQFLKDIPLLET